MVASIYPERNRDGLVGARARAGRDRHLGSGNHAALGGVRHWGLKARRKNAAISSVAKSVAAQERLVDGDGRLRAFRDGYCDKKDVARHVARNIYAGNTGFFRIGINYNAAFRIPLAAKTFRIDRTPDGSRSKRTDRPGASQARFRIRFS